VNLAHVYFNLGMYVNAIKMVSHSCFLFQFFLAFQCLLDIYLVSELLEEILLQQRHYTSSIHSTRFFRDWKTGRLQGCFAEGKKRFSLYADQI